MSKGAQGLKMIDHRLLGESMTALITAIVTAMATWLLASVKKISRGEMDARFAERDKLVIQPLKDQIHNLEVSHKEFVTRTEFNSRFDSLDRQIQNLTDLVRDNLTDIVWKVMQEHDAPPSAPPSRRR